MFRKEVEETFANIETLHDKTSRCFDLYKKSFAKFLQWQGKCQDAYNKMVLKIVVLEKKDQEKTEQVKLL